MIVRGFILKTPGEYAAISDLVRVHACPVRFYYERHEPVTESDRYAVCKQISYHLGKELDAPTIWDEVMAVRPVTDPAAKEFLDLCIAACSKKEWKPASQTDVRVISDIQKMAGMIDRITDEGTFSIIRASGAMPFGAYATDRLRVAAIALCLEEMTGSEVKGGNIEYIPDGVARFHEVQPRDRRMVISTLHKLREIREGAMPQHPLNAPCKRCRYHEKCESSVGKRLSELL
jgi:CRISPR-associated exonuclease Cas4